MIELEHDYLAFVAVLSGRNPTRDLRMLAIRRGLSGSRNPTLEEAGKQFGMTRQGARLICDRAEDDIRRWLGANDFALLQEARFALAERGDVASPADIVNDLDPKVVCGELRLAPLVHWILDLSEGRDIWTVTQRGRQIVVGPAIGLWGVEAARQEIGEALEAEQYITLEELSSVVESVWPDQALSHPYALARVRLLAELEGYQVLPGLFSRRSWYRADHAEFILENEGGPLHFTEIAKRVGGLMRKPCPAVSFNTLLNTDGRFVRVGQGDFTLARWGPQRYGRFDEVIERYLKEKAEPQHVDTIAHDLLEEYTVTESTVKAMLSWPSPTGRSVFRHYGGGYWGLVDRPPILDAELERRASEARGQSQRPLTPAEVTTLVSRQDSDHPASLADVRRMLYVSPRFNPTGSYADRRFVLARQGDEPTA